MTPVQNIYGITVDAPARNDKEYHAQKSHYESESSPSPAFYSLPSSGYGNV